ncbi:MAG: hypothetical protein ACOY94_23935 [Bacillota bacterium]
MEPLALLAADDRLPAYLELEQDVVFPHLTPARRAWYVEQALEIGRVQARPHRGRPLGLLAQELGARVVRTDRENRIAGMEIRAEHDAGTGSITIYEPSITQVHRLLAQVLPEPWDRERVAELHIAHELFHHLESTRILPVHEELPPVVTFRLGRLWATRTRARRCREIAAHAFAKEVLGLPFLPNAVDWLMLVGLKRWSLDELTAALERAQRGLAENEGVLHA